MTITPAQLAALRTAPTVSDALREAARHAADGPIPALSKSVYGSANPDDYAGFTSPEHTLAWGVALIATARFVSLKASDWPESAWDADRWAHAVADAHRALTSWADRHTAGELADLFRLAAAEAREAEQ